MYLFIMNDTSSPAPKKRTAKPKLDKPTEQKPTKTSKKIAIAEEKVTKPEEQPHDTYKPVPEQFLTDLASLAEILETNSTIFEPIREVFEYQLIRLTEKPSRNSSMPCRCYLERMLLWSS